MDGFVSAYSTITGKKQRVPAHFIGHPVLGRNLQVTPAAVAARPFFLARNGEVHATEDPAGDPVVPDESWKRELLDTYARDIHDLDTAGLANKGEVLAAIQEAVEAADNQDSDGDPSSDQTPVTGEEEE